MKKMAVEIDCGDIYCLNCKFREVEPNDFFGQRCILFKKQLRFLNQGKRLRLDECRKSEIPEE